MLRQKISSFRKRLSPQLLNAADPMNLTIIYKQFLPLLLSTKKKIFKTITEN